MKNFKQLTVGLAVALFFAGATNVFAQADGDLPPNAVAGKCYAKCLIPDQYETVTEQILLKEASSRIEVVPAVYETVSEQLLVKEGYKVLEIVPATFTTVDEQILVKEAGSRLDYVPPVYETVTEQVLVSPATTKWVQGKADRNCLNEDPEKCKVWCLTEVPAQYKTVTKQVLKTPATTRETPIPAEYKTITKAVVQTPASTREREVAAEYKTVTKQVLRSPATTREVEVPAEYSTITSQKLVKTGGFTDWVEVLCEAKVTAAKVREVQEALKTRGYDPGPADNVMGPRTKAALVQFQKDNGLPTGNLNIETLRALGVSGK
ncbi:MAG TPA: peptidoglycan-binding domain-containing protein [Chitinophagales bacterium]|nr:peptidoglycan-binding domain-containing protein [Chitinophagales bacterium]